jgi:TnpA family transposase
MWSGFPGTLASGSILQCNFPPFSAKSVHLQFIYQQVNKKLIVEQWDEMQRVASSIRHGTVSASLLMRKLAAYPRQNQVARALTEFGKLERTSFLLEYFRDAALRRRILIGLNKGEALHSLARQLFFGRLGEMRDRALEDQIHRASCLHLLIAAWIPSIWPKRSRHCVGKAK